MRAVLALQGVNWRVWSAADRVAVGYLLLKRHSDETDLRFLYELVGDREALAALDRQKMNQPRQLEVH